MLDLILTGLTIGFVAACNAMFLIEISNYGGVLGWLRLKIAVSKATESDLIVMESILTDKELDASQVAEAMNKQFYWHIAKHSRLMFAILCKYCTGTWVLAICLLLFYLTFEIELPRDAVTLIPLSIAGLFFTLKLAK